MEIHADEYQRNAGLKYNITNSGFIIVLHLPFTMKSLMMKIAQMSKQVL